MIALTDVQIALLISFVKLNEIYKDVLKTDPSTQQVLLI